MLAVGLLIAALRGDSYDAVPRSETFLVLWWVLGLGIAFGVVPQGRPSRPARLALAALLALAAWTALGLLTTESVERSYAEVLRVLGFAGLVALVAFTFDDRDRPVVVGVVGAVAATVCVLALISRLWPELLSGGTARAGYHASRLGYPFNYWNALGCWAAMTLAVTTAFSVHARQRWARGVALAVAPLAVSVAYLTFSRATMASAAFALVLVVALSSRRWHATVHALVAAAGGAAVIIAIRAAPEINDASGTSGRWAVAGVAVLAAVGAAAIAMLLPAERLGQAHVPRRLARRALLAAGAAALVAAVVVGPAVANRAWDSFAHDAPVDARAGTDPAQRLTNLSGNRRLLWSVALDAFDEHPVRGSGAGTFDLVWDRSPRRAGHVLDAHSVVIEALAEVGLPGAILVVVAFAALLAAAVRVALRAPEGPARGAAVGAAAAFVVFAVSAGVDWMWESTAVACVAFVLGTVAVARPRRPGVTVPRRRMRLGGSVVAAAVILLQVPLLAGAAQTRQSQRDARDGRFVGALRHANAAAQAQPWAASAYLQRALVLEEIGQLDMAADAARKATQRERTNWEPWLVLGRIEAQRGRIGPALRAVGRARRLNPRAPLFQPGVAEDLVRRAGRTP